MAFAVQPAAAQEYATTTVDKTRVWVGGGYQFLSLPEIQFTGTGGLGNLKRQNNTEKDFWDIGGSTGAGIETAFGMWGDVLVSGAVKGFYSNVETDRRVKCNGGGVTCVVIDPTGANTFLSSTLNTKATKDADYWGGQAELKFATGAPREIKPELYRMDYYIAGFDIRGIDQDSRVHSSAGTVFTYKENLETTYTGGYIGFGGEYSFGFIPVVGNAFKQKGGILDRLGLRTYLNATAGLYNAETDYTGTFSGPAATSTRLSNSNDELAFIGTVSLETRAQLSDRTSLSFWTDYEYISSVPQLHYARPGGSTRLTDDDLFASRTMLRLNIGLGSQQLYADAPYAPETYSAAAIK
ncbi:MAG: hypothetical protein KDJ72_11755 [Methyloceanibacter sp.]|nr:hypothetical protein [Methyloceanibacter sp.]